MYKRQVGSSKTVTKYLSYFGRINYDISDKYLFTFTPVSYTHLFSFPTFYMFVIAYLPMWLSLTTRVVKVNHKGY